MSKSQWMGRGLGAVLAGAWMAGAASTGGVTPAPAAAAVEQTPFPRYESLQPQIAFWTRVFGEYSEHQSVVHSAEYPHKIFTVLDFRDEALRMDRAALDRLRAKEERRAKQQADALLKRVHAKRANPAAMSADERKLFDLFADVKDDRRFIRLVGTTRAQRGLKERTRLALETSGKYLPEMERTFARYQLPVALTRLPLVESSFNVEAYSKVGAAGLWQFIPSSARIYMRLNDVVDDRRDPWLSTDAAARHLRDDYAELRDWPLAITAYNHGRSGVAKALRATNSTSLPEVIQRYRSQRFGFASRNFYTEFVAAVEVEREYRKHFGEVQRKSPLAFDIVETRHYVPYETLQRLSGADGEQFRKLNPAYRPEVLDGKLYVPPGHTIRVPPGSTQSFELAYARLGSGEVHDAQRLFHLLHKVQRGEVLSRIASRYGVAQSSIMQANGLRKASLLRIGQVLKIPARHERRPGPVTAAAGEPRPPARAQKASGASYRLHKVRRGQTLSSIARSYRVSIAALREANGLGKSSLIRAGMKLKVPVSS